MHGGAHRMRIVGVDAHGFRHFVNRPGHFTEYQHTAAPLFAGDVFFGNQIHAVADGGDEHNVGLGIQCDDFAEWAILELVGYWRPAYGAVGTVNAADSFFDFVAELLVGFYASARWHGYH